MSKAVFMLLSKCQVIFSMMSDNQIKVTYIYSNHYDNCDLGNVFKLLHRWWIVYDALQHFIATTKASEAHISTPQFYFTVDMKMLYVVSFI